VIGPQQHYLVDQEQRMLALSKSQQVSTSRLYLSVYVHLHLHLHLHLCVHCVAKLKALALTLDMLSMFAMFRYVDNSVMLERQLVEPRHVRTSLFLVLEHHVPIFL
jgi:hypothetical protein